MAWFHLYEAQAPQTYNKIKAAGAERLGRNKRELSDGDETILYLARGVYYTGICICHNLSNCVLKCT